MPTEVILPRVDMDMTEGMIAAWHVSEGDEFVQFFARISKQDTR